MKTKKVTEEVNQKQLLSDKYWNIAKKILHATDVEINGERPWDLKIKNKDVFHRIFTKKALGLGESFMDGWWECDQLDEFFSKILRARLDVQLKSNKKLLLEILTARFFNRQSKKRAYQVGKSHYELDNNLFAKMLDKRMVYSCAYWKNATTLDQAQENKLQLICDKLRLKPGMKLLDIGCGWGSLVKYAAENYGVSCVGITISKEQKRYADELCKGLPVEIKLQDYREIDEKFDRVVSVGMIEHVGYKNYQTYMKVVANSLDDEGLFLLHTIGSNKSQKSTNEWTDKYIFPNGMLPSIQQLGKAIEGLFVFEDLHNFGSDYDKTLMSWYNNFIENWEELKNQYDNRFYRMWTYYLLSSAGSFRSRTIQLWQIILSKNGVTGGYKSRY